MLRSLRIRDPRIIGLLVVLWLAMMFSAYKIATAFDRDTGPEYARVPPSAFATVAPPRLVEGNLLTVARLPDDAYIEVFDSMRAVSDQLVNFTADTAFLREQGMSSEQAKLTVQTMDTVQAQLPPGTSGRLEGEASVQSVTASSVQLVQQVVYLVANAPLTVTYTANYSTEDGQSWQLDSVQIESGVIASGTP